MSYVKKDHQEIIETFSITVCMIINVLINILIIIND